MKVTIKEHHLKFKTGVSTLMEKAENNGIYNIESEKKGVGYVVDKDDFAIVTASGYLRTDTQSARVLAEEILMVLDDVSYRNRLGLQLVKDNGIKAHGMG